MVIPRVGIIVVNYAGSDKTAECVRSILDLDYKGFRVFVIDNFSTNAELDMLRRSVPSEVEILSSPVNIGFGGAANIGITASIAAGCSFAWVLNNDVVLHPHSLAHLVTAADKLPDVAIPLRASSEV